MPEYLQLRHAEPESGVNPHLSPRGREQAEAAAYWIKETFKNPIVYAGKSNRTQETGLIVANIVGARCIPTELLGDEFGYTSGDISIAEELIQLINQQPEHDIFILVTHAPNTTLPALINRFIDGFRLLDSQPDFAEGIRFNDNSEKFLIIHQGDYV